MSKQFIKHFLSVGTLISIIAQLSSAACEIPGANPNGKTPSNNKQVCLSESQFLVQPPAWGELDIKALIANPKVKNLAINNGDDVYCRYHYQKQNGASTKFRCALTNAENQLFDSKGNLVPEAVSLRDENDDVFLIDANGNKINDAEAMILKVRYHDGNKRNVENYTSTAASRIMWLLGAPAHTNIMTNKIICFGCSKSPFKGQSSFINGETNEFKDASIEIKFKGKRIYAPTEAPWKWSDLKSMNLDQDKQLQIDILALTSNLLGYTSDDHFQNAIVCVEKDESQPHLCKKTVAMTHDIGAAFGDRTKSRGFLGLGGDRPRGDLRSYERTSVFKKGTCSFNYSGSTLPVTVSKTAQQEFLNRAASLTYENLQIIFNASHMGNIGNSNPDEAVNLNNRWAMSVLNKIIEIRNAPCQ